MSSDEKIESIKRALNESLEEAKHDIFEKIVYYQYVLSGQHNSLFPYTHSLKLNSNNCCEQCGWIDHQNETKLGCGHTPSEHAHAYLKEAEAQYDRLNSIADDTIDQIARGVKDAIEKH
jgi:hypothetical protein